MPSEVGVEAIEPSWISVNSITTALCCIENLVQLVFNLLLYLCPLPYLSTHSTFVLYLDISWTEVVTPLPSPPRSWLPSLDFVNMSILLFHSLNNQWLCSWHESTGHVREPTREVIVRWMTNCCPIVIASIVRRDTWSCLHGHVMCCNCVKTVAGTSKTDPTLNKYTMIHSWQ